MKRILLITGDDTGPHHADGTGVCLSIGSVYTDTGEIRKPGDFSNLDRETHDYDDLWLKEVSVFEINPGKGPTLGSHFAELLMSRDKDKTASELDAVTLEVLKGGKVLQGMTDAVKRALDAEHDRREALKNVPVSTPLGFSVDAILAELNELSGHELSHRICDLNKDSLAEILRVESGIHDDVWQACLAELVLRADS